MNFPLVHLVSVKETVEFTQTHCSLGVFWAQADESTAAVPTLSESPQEARTDVD